ncbi:hypothetical protein JCGZ_06681 [Jatropha curcas]|uniref:LOB domain-containing protein n=1 Tax=Jatropha curcas TaxID=180498 RepID=A0A067LMX1_JATCU|nr:hypothetical protein JCGZ_06681 [Jatropha curcas]
MGNNPFLFAPTDSYSQPSPSSSSSQSPLPSPSPSSNSCSSRPSSDSSPSLNSPLQPSRQSLPQLPSHTSSSHFDPPSAAVVEPCAACKILRRRCTDKCFLASYFPSTTEQYKFNIIDSVFGVRNAVKFLQGLPECQRGDAVSSMVYEANARIRDPVYGCVGQISLLQKQVDELQAQLAKAQAERVHVRVSLYCPLCISVFVPAHTELCLNVGVEPHNFTVVDSLFGLSNVVEFLQQNSNSLSYVPLLLLLRDTSKDGSQLQANPSKISNIASTGTPVNINGQPMLANFENSKAHSYNSSSKPPMMFGTNHAGTLTSPVNKFGDNNDLEFQVNKADMEDESLKGNVAPQDDTEGFTFVEVNSVRASADKVVCCDFSSDGKLLASGGHDKKVVLWDTERENLKSNTILEEHSSLITDVRFSPSMPQLATSSFDKTVKVWDTNDPNKSTCTFTGHSTPIMSIDFHPFKDDLICSCDADSELRYWSIQNGTCLKISKGGTAQIRFQPRLGRYLAAANENVVNIFDVETQARVSSFQGHYEPIDSLCWDPSGQYLASPSHQSLPSPPSQNSSNHFSWPSKDVVGPCAACKILRRQCTDKCYLASYFPSTTEPHNFTVVDSRFGLSDVHEFLQGSVALEKFKAIPQ